jgi:hypothetical protein
MSNIYLNEFDRLMMHQLKPSAYLRYGDDWLCFASSKAELEQIRTQAVAFLSDALSLTVNPKIDHIRQADKGVSYLGVDIWPHDRRLQPKVRNSVAQRISPDNSSSYKALVAAHEKAKRLRELNWLMLES